MNENTAWIQLMTSALKTQQQLRLSNQQVQITITNQQLSFSQQKLSKQKMTCQETVIKVIKKAIGHSKVESFENGNVYEEIQQTWNKINTQT